MEGEPEEINLLLSVAAGLVFLFLILCLVGLGALLHWTGTVRIKRKGLLVQVLAAAAFSLLAVFIGSVIFSLAGRFLEANLK